MSSNTQFDLPGFTKPLDYMPPQLQEYASRPFPNALCDYFGYSHSFQALYTHREIVMVQIMNSITEKPEWDRKVFNEEITSKWRREISQSGQDVTELMMDWIIKELQCKAEELQKEGLVCAFDIGVVKSDTAVPEQLKQLLKEAAAPLENVPEEQKDYHPGTDKQVVDLVHQSLFPVVYGRTHILRDKKIGLDDCLNSMGQGELLPISSIASDRSLSKNFQWLPCDVKFLEDDEGCQITSYINNVHPVKHRPLYEAVEKIISRTIPLWNKSLTLCSDSWHPRIKYDFVEYLDHPDGPEPVAQEGEDEDSDEFHDRRMQWERNCPIKQPEPDLGDFEYPHVPWKNINLRDQYRENGLQVIVKMANIELTPEAPEYKGGSWHIEGQLNERICATALYYYDSENITESVLRFRHRADHEAANEISYEQQRHEFIHQVFGFPQFEWIDQLETITQDLGGVVCKEDRLLTFPNIVQHCVAPFSLADRSKPGHRKILALFLVDPHMRIISSAHVPPQQKDWGIEREQLIGGLLSRNLPVELQEMVRDGLDSPLMSLDEAKAHRLKLMEERSIQSKENNETFEMGDFSLCEH
ncbi:hypothetical protein N7457_002514 [Penicillium paradoxum]|uniref:uncharacterized protein n=1 Tax=Penicillium paradoxum TaxID=176176 RepID=UPI0025468BC8|nr:uncharacterized protein N7457_002514 [Penicillium paradoxum]KAJ5787524.1 hypothetical protein N7457_002514 [Penicillium paradoxum]